MKLGEPCWNRENVEKAISHIAQVDAARMHYFLASHSPIKFITDARLDRDLTEEEFFQSLFLILHTNSWALSRANRVPASHTSSVG